MGIWKWSLIGKWLSSKLKRESVKNLPHGPIENLPYGVIIEGPMTIQCVCPVCPYAQGYNEPFLASFYEQVPVTCKKCKTRFIALQ